MKEFEESGYDVQYRILNSANYGVPQKRERVIIVGFRKDLNIATGTMTKMRKNEEVALSILLRICDYLDCNIGDIMDISDDCKKNEKKIVGKNRLDNRCPLVHTILSADTKTYTGEGE